MERCHTSGGNIKRCGHFGKAWHFLQLCQARFSPFRLIVLKFFDNIMRLIGRWEKGNFLGPGGEGMRTHLAFSQEMKH